MISLTRIIEQSGMEGQYYDLGRDFMNFRRAMENTSDAIAKKYEKIINSKIKGKRVRARSSRGYKQFEKDYEFDVNYVTIDDYYDNYVVVAHDTSGKKPKEYFLKPAIKIQIIGNAATNYDSLDPQPEPLGTNTTPVPQPTSGNGGLATPQAKSNDSIREDETVYQAYPIRNIIDDITKWAKPLMKDSRLGVSEFVPRGGWTPTNTKGRDVMMYDLVMPKQLVKIKISEPVIQKLLSKVSNSNEKFELLNFEETRDGYRMRLKKTVPKVTTPTKA